MTKVMDYPPTAMKVTFKPLGEKQVTYRVWKKGNDCFWYANGHSGKEATVEAAMRAAREYITMGVSGLKSHGENRGVFNNAS